MQSTTEQIFGLDPHYASMPAPVVIEPAPDYSVERTQKQPPLSEIVKTQYIKTEGVYMKCMWIPANTVFYNKRVPDTHVSILAMGVMALDNGERIIKGRAPMHYEIPAMTRYAMKTLTDCVIYCVHATELTDLEELDKIY